MHHFDYGPITRGGGGCNPPWIWSIRWQNLGRKILGRRGEEETLSPLYLPYILHKPLIPLLDSTRQTNYHHSYITPISNQETTSKTSTTTTQLHHNSRKIHPLTGHLAIKPLEKTQIYPLLKAKDNTEKCLGKFLFGTNDKVSYTTPTPKEISTSHMDTVFLQCKVQLHLFIVCH